MVEIRQTNETQAANLVHKLNAMDDARLMSIRRRAKACSTRMSCMGDMILLMELDLIHTDNTITVKDIYYTSTQLLLNRGKKIRV